MKRIQKQYAEASKLSPAGKPVPTHLPARTLALMRPLFNSRFLKKPFFISHLVTTRCNCRCPMCLWRDNESGQEMNAAEIGGLYRKSREAGFLGAGIWGGEPLLRSDLEDLLSCHSGSG